MKSDHQLCSSHYVYLCGNNGGTWKEVHKALRVFWLTPRKGWEVSSCSSTCNWNEISAYMQLDCTNSSLYIPKTPTYTGHTSVYPWINTHTHTHTHTHKHTGGEERGPEWVSQGSWPLPALVTGMTGQVTRRVFSSSGAQNAGRVALK